MAEVKMSHPDKKQKMSILIVDDEPKNIQLLATILDDEEDLYVEFALSGEETLVWVENNLFDLILLDIMMPGMDGYEVCKQIKESEKTKDIPIIFLTAKTDSESIVQGFEIGAIDYITKPFNKAELLARVRTHLKVGDLQKQLQKHNDELELRVEERTAALVQLNTVYERFVPHGFLSLLEKRSILDIQLGDQVEKNMSVLFSDIRSFTLLSEKMTPEQNFQFVNSYLKKMGPLVRKHHGFIDKFIGDAIMALFHGTADDAIQAAIAMFQMLEEHNQIMVQQGFPAIEVGIGINTGMTMLGILGENHRMDGTAISDTVNLASRLEGLTKVYKTNLLISEHTLQNVENPNRFHIRFLDQVKVKGKTEAVTIYEVYDADPVDLRLKKENTVKIYRKAWELFHQKEFQQARTLFEECVKENPEDMPAKMFIHRCRKILEIGHDINWEVCA